MKDVEAFEENLKEIRKLETKFANYLCEDVKKFKLEEVFLVFKQFCDNINTAKKVRCSTAVSLYLLMYSISGMTYIQVFCDPLFPMGHISYLRP